MRTIEEAASSFAVELIAVEVHDDAEIERAISDIGREPNGGLFVLPDTFNFVHRRTIIALADRYRVPGVYFFPFFAADGGLITDLTQLTWSSELRAVSIVSSKVPAGPTADQLPAGHQSQNRQAGLTIPQSLLVRADEVIK